MVRAALPMGRSAPRSVSTCMLIVFVPPTSSEKWSDLPAPGQATDPSLVSVAASLPIGPPSPPPAPEDPADASCPPVEPPFPALPPFPPHDPPLPAVVLVEP